MSTRIDITLLAALSTRAAFVQAESREIEKKEKQEKEIKSELGELFEGSSEILEEIDKLKVWEPEETRPYYNPFRKDDGLLAVWVLQTSDETVDKYYVSGATTNNWTLLYEQEKSSGSSESEPYFFGNNFASIIAGNPFNIPPILWPGNDIPNGFTTHGYWNGAYSLSPTGSAPWNGKWSTPWVYFNHIDHPVYGACSAWVDNLGNSTAGSSAATDTVNFWPAGGLKAFCTRKKSVGSSGAGVRRFLWHGIGSKDRVNGKMPWRHMYREYPLSLSSTAYSESGSGLKIFGNIIEEQDVNASSLFGHFYSKRGTGPISSVIEKSYGQLYFTRTGRNNWTLGWNGIAPDSFSVIGTYKQACLDLGLSTGVPPVSNELFNWGDAMNLMNDRVGSPRGAPRVRRMTGASGMIARPGQNDGTQVLRYILPGNELKNPLWYSDTAPAFKENYTSFITVLLSTPNIYNNTSKTMIPDPGWKYYADRSQGVFAVNLSDLSGSSPEVYYQSKIELLDRVNEAGTCYLKKHVLGTGYIDTARINVKIDTEIMQELVLDEETTYIALCFITDWAQGSACQQAAATIGLS
jgi:hypothetical protein